MVEQSQSKISARKKRKQKRKEFKDNFSTYKEGQDFYQLSPEEQKNLFQKMEKQAA